MKTLNKKTTIILTSLIIALIGIGCIGAALLLRGRDDKYIKSAEEGDISRYEWMEMLCSQSGITEFQNTEPYFTDVSADSPYFAYIQSAVEWEVLEEDKAFEGDGYASGRFVLLTAMKSLGEKNLKLYLNTEDSITDDVYLQTALEQDLLAEEELAQGVSMETAEQVLEQIALLKYTVFWADDYEEVVYQDGVVEIAPADILAVNEDGSEITVSENAVSAIAVGTIIVYQPNNVGLKTAARVVNVDENGKLTLTDDVEMEEVLESLVVSDIVELSAEDIFNYYGLAQEYTAEDIVYKQGSAGAMMPMWGASKEISDKGFAIEASVEEGENGGKNYIQVKITDNNTNLSITLPIKYEVSWDSGYKVELDVSKINAAAHIEMKKAHLEYAEAALDIKSTVSGGIKTVQASHKIKLFETPTPLGSGICGINIQVYLVVSLDGEISLEAELPASFCIRYDKDKGIRNESSKPQIKNPELTVDCEADFMLRVEPVLTCLFGDIMDMELDLGAAVAAEVSTRPTEMVCMDLSMTFPVIKISLLGDDELDTFLGDIIKKPDEWEIISGDDAPFKKGAHVEIADGVSSLVAECTYKESANAEEKAETENVESVAEETAAETETEAQQGNTFENTYVTQYGNTRFAFDYPDGWTVTGESSRDSEWNGDYMDYYRESVELTNGSGGRITYTEYKMDPGGVASGSAYHYIMDYYVEKVADSSLKLKNVPAIVARIQELDGTEDWNPDGPGTTRSFDSDAVSYAVMLGDKVGLQTTNLPGYDRMCSFYYPEPDDYQIEFPDGSIYTIDPYTFIEEGHIPYTFIAEGSFTQEEEAEVIAILQSFREVP
ncbi:MAG: hypothetical protein NC313_09900 [Butyrivibrio sp.]|nr:hypothetical protein [Butyrivibrio sp.]